MKLSGGIIAGLAGALLWMGVAQAGNVSYPGFSAPTGLSINGDAEVAGDKLRLVKTGDQAGSAFTEKTFVKSDKSFRSKFMIKMHHTNFYPGDGMAFVLHADTETAVGEGGGGLGYSGIADSVAVELDLFKNDEQNDPSGPHVAVTSGGPSNHIASSDAPGLYGKKLLTWVSYSANSERIKVFVSKKAKKPKKPLVSTKLDLATVTGVPRLRAGFTAGTGEGSVKADVLSWNLRQ